MRKFDWTKPAHGCRSVVGNGLLWSMPRGSDKQQLSSDRLHPVTATIENHACSRTAIHLRRLPVVLDFAEIGHLVTGMILNYLGDRVLEVMQRYSRARMDSTGVPW
jgi:hypothetical protein